MRCYSIFLPRNKRTFDWLERHCGDDWDTDMDDNQGGEVFVTFDNVEDSVLAALHLHGRGSHGLN
jgi:hypothetical protein